MMLRRMKKKNDVLERQAAKNVAGAGGRNRSVRREGQRHESMNYH